MAGFMPQSVQDVQKAVESMIEDLQMNVLVPKQKEAFLCCAKCCDSASSARNLESCVQQCSQSTQDCQRVIQRELGEFQERFQRAAIRCQDEAKDSIPLGMEPSQADQARATAKFNRCMETTGQEFLDKVPKLKADLMAALRRR